MNKTNANKKYGFKHFYFFQRVTPDLILELTRDNPVASSVYLLLLHCSSNIGCCEVAQPDIANFVHKSVRTVARAINYLASNYYIAIAHTGRSNIYVLNFNQVWGNYNFKKPIVMKYISLPTNSIIKRSKRNKKFFSTLDSFVHNHVNKMIDLKNAKQKPLPKADKYFTKKAEKERAKEARAKQKVMADKLRKELYKLEKSYGQLKGLEKAKHITESSLYDKNKRLAQNTDS